MNTVLKILLAQLGLSAALAAVAGVWLDRVAAYSVFIGGLICVLPNAFLGLRMLAVDAAREPKRALRAVWIGELGKLGLTAVLFGTVFVTVRPLNGLALFVGFIAAQGVVLAALVTRAGVKA